MRDIRLFVSQDQERGDILSKKRDDAINAVLVDAELLMNNIGYDTVWASFCTLRWAFFARHESRTIFNAAVAVYRAAIRGEEYTLPEFSEVIKYYSPHWTRLFEKAMCKQEEELLLMSIYKEDKKYDL